MALQANKANIGSCQHSWIRRSMRLVTRRAAFKAHRCMFEREWTPFVAMTREAPRLIGREAYEHGVPNTAMRIVAVDTAHRSLRQLVTEGPLELGPHI